MDLAKLKKLEAKASPAPWEPDSDKHDTGDLFSFMMDAKGQSIFDSINIDYRAARMEGEADDDGGRIVWDEASRATFEFIAEMRNATPAMIARIEKLEAALKPFADTGDAYERSPSLKLYPDDFLACTRLEHFRKARLVMEGK